MTGSDSELSEILTSANTLAVVGIKDSESADAYRIPHYMQQRGYRVLPVNPKFDQVLGEPCVAALGDLNEAVDIVDIFRAIDHIPGHVEEILAMKPRPMTAWMQLGILHGAGAAALRATGIKVVQDRCIMVEHQRLLGR